MSEKYDPDRPWVKYATFDEDYKTLTTEIPKTNYDGFIKIMSPRMLAFLFAENRCTNCCVCCSEMINYAAGNISCDMECQKHLKEFLDSPYSKKDIDKATRHMYIPK